MVQEPQFHLRADVIGITITNPKSQVLKRVNEDATLFRYESV